VDPVLAGGWRHVAVRAIPSVHRSAREDLPQGTNFTSADFTRIGRIVVCQRCGGAEEDEVAN
jgi:hypothetical protein